MHTVEAGTRTRLGSLSVFFPCFNEEGNLETLAATALQFFPTVAEQFELILVDDGSTDATGAICDRLAAAHREIRAVHHPVNQGYGGAIRSGLKSARFEWIFFTDADLQFRLEDLMAFLPFASDHDAVIGYRAERAEGWRRATNAALYKAFIEGLLGLGVRDIDCAFKLLRASTAQALQLTSRGAFTSAELLYRMKQRGARIKELAVGHHCRQWGRPTGSNLRVIWRAGFEALHFWAVGRRLIRVRPVRN